MQNPSPSELFESTFTDVVKTTIVEAVRRAYDTACEHHVPEQGSNAATFGFNLYHYAVHELCGETEDVELMRVISRAPLFRLGVGEFELACHRVGNTERENISGSFPNNEGAACKMVEEQFWLPGVPAHLGIEQARKLVIAHFGNAEDGFRAIYLCIPGKTEGTRITEWAFTMPLWTADEVTTAIRAVPSLPPEEVVEAPLVRRKQSTPAEALSRIASELPPEEQVEQVAVPRKGLDLSGKELAGDETNR
jgi:hypothetical protein